MIHDLLREEVDHNYKSEVVFKDPFQRTEVLGYLTRFRNMIKDYEFETIFTEKTFISDKLGYGGTIDWFALFFNKYYMLNGAIYIRKVEYKDGESCLLENDEYAYIMSQHNSVDIDTMLDFIVAEAMIKGEIN